MKKKTKYDFLVINRVLNGNWNGGNNQFFGKTKGITNSEENKLKQKEMRNFKYKKGASGK